MQSSMITVVSVFLDLCRKASPASATLAALVILGLSGPREVLPTFRGGVPANEATTHFQLGP